jgi:hypothetical protein
MLTASRYVDGTIVDLSLAWTIPHIFVPEAGLRPAWTFMSMAAYDLWSFQTYIIDVWNAADREECPELPAYICPVRAYPADGIYNRLRPLVHRQRPFLPIINREMDIIDLTGLPPHDPADFDRRKTRLMASKKRETAGGRHLNVPRSWNLELGRIPLNSRLGLSPSIARHHSYDHG